MRDNLPPGVSERHIPGSAPEMVQVDEDHAHF
jgi:hypothetical protein